MMNQEVRRIMTTNPVVANPQQTISDVSNLMIENQLQQLPVVDEGKLVGLITTHDLWKRLETTSSLSNLQVKDVMNTHVVKIQPKDKVGTAAELFADKRFKTLPVVNLSGELKGVITAFDLIRVVFREQYKEPILFREAFSPQ